MSPVDPTIAAVVRQRTGLSWSRARSLCSEGRVRVDGERCLDPAARIPPDAVVEIDMQAPKRERGPLARSAIVFFDRDVVVVEKPAGMLAVADEPGNRETLAEHARLLLRRLDDRARDTGLGVVHRLDKETSGLMVFARTAEAKRKLATRFRAHDIERIYHAIVHGVVVDQRVESEIVPDRGDGLRGSHGVFRRGRAEAPPEARRAVTDIRAIATLSGATLVECRLETGRQHQIRIHLAELGHPLLGERVYIRDYNGPKIDAPRTMLHARALGFAHPRDGRRIFFEREAPEDFAAMVESLRR